MKVLSLNDKFVLSSSCKVVKGATRTLLNDYLRNEVRFIPNAYYDLIQTLNRAPILQTRKKIDAASHAAFDEFVTYMITNEYGYIVQDLDLFPEISENVNDDHVILKDCIIEIDTAFFNAMDFQMTINEIDSLNCDDLQIRFLSPITISFVTKILYIAQLSSINCIEIHCANNNINDNDWFEIIEAFATLSHVFIYASNKSSKNEHIIHRTDHAPLLMGVVHHISSTLSKEHCGIISKNNLSLMHIGMYQLTQKFNGCLYKKLTIDRKGYIKNCPYMEQHFGKVSKGAVRKMVSSPRFQSLWFIHKDDISVCQDCEFRYNCTDCRAFITDNANLKSKPKKCGYNPYTNTWDVKSNNSLKRYETA